MIHPGAHTASSASYDDLPPEQQALADVLTRAVERHVEPLQAEVSRLRSDLLSLQQRFSEVLLTREEAAKRLDCSTRTVIRYEKDGRLQRVEGVRGVRYHPQQVRDLAKKRRR